MKDILESTIGNEVQKVLDDYTIEWSDSLTADTIVDVFIAMAKFLGIKKNKDKPVVVELRDQNGGFHFAGYVTFMVQQEAGSDEGSWSLNYTFDESDIESEWEKYNLMTTPEAFMTFIDTTYVKHAISWRFTDQQNGEASEGTPAHIIPILFDVLKRYMQANVTTNPELSIRTRAYLKAEISGNTVYITVTPSAELKSYIKDDQAIGVAR